MQGAHDDIIAAENSAAAAVIASAVPVAAAAAAMSPDLSYAQVSDPHYPGSVARGFSSSANLVWPAVEAALQQQVLNGTVTAVTLAGHSLGAAMATLLAFRAQVGLTMFLSVLPCMCLLVQLRVEHSCCIAAVLLKSREGKALMQKVWMRL